MEPSETIDGGNPIRRHLDTAWSLLPGGILLSSSPDLSSEAGSCSKLLYQSGRGTSYVYAKSLKSPALNLTARSSALLLQDRKAKSEGKEKRRKENVWRLNEERDENNEAKGLEDRQREEKGNLREQEK